MRAFLIALAFVSILACQAAPMAQPRNVTYTLQAGDTLAGIANRFYGDQTKWRDIAAANPEQRPEVMRIGQVITIPAVPPDRQP